MLGRLIMERWSPSGTTNEVQMVLFLPIIQDSMLFLKQKTIQRRKFETILRSNEISPLVE